MSWPDDPAALTDSDAASQRVARSWFDSEPYRAIRATFAELDDAVEEVVAAARLLLADADWVEALLQPLIGALAHDPAFEPPLRIHRDPMRIGAVLYEDARVTITATVLSADALATAPAPTGVVVPGRVSVVRYHQAAGAILQTWYAGIPAEPFEAASAFPCVGRGTTLLSDGEVRVLDGRREGHIVTWAPRDLVTVTVQLRIGAAPVMRDYRIADGALRRVATLDDAASRTHMLLTLLRLSGRADAAGCFEAATHDRSFALRWAAMREWLALDIAAALPRLRAMAANDDHEEVRAAAQATLPRAEALLCPG